MPTTPVPVFQARFAVQYTGSNSAEIAALIDDFTVTGEDASNLMSTSGGTNYTVPRNGRIVYADGVVEATFSNDDDFYDAWSEVKLGSHVHDITITSGPAKMAEEYGV